MLTKIRARMQALSIPALLLTDEQSRRYVSGLYAAGTVLITEKSALYLTDFRYIEAAQAKVKHMTVDMTTREKTAKDIVKALLAEEGITELGYLGSQMTVAALEGWRKDTMLSFRAVPELLAELRTVKTAAEQDGIRMAQAAAERALNAALPLIRPGVTERRLSAELIYQMYLNGADKPSFDPIVVSGENSSLPHGEPGNRAFKSGDFITIDMGVRLGGYCSDMTRTYALGCASEEMRRVYGTVLEAQLAALAAVKPGKTGAEIDAAARSIIETAGFKDFFGHGLGHGVGLDIHEPPTLSPAGDKVLAPGMIVTVEPGVYLPGKFGVRIEDLAAVTEDGCENFTSLPKELTILPC